MNKHVLVIILVSCSLLTNSCSLKSRTDIQTKGEFPVYGNWCGPSHPREGTYPPTIDEIDQACKKHDECYAQKGYFSCECDNILMKDIAMIKKRREGGRTTFTYSEFSSLENDMTRVMKSYFSVTGCKPTGLGDIATKGVYGAATAADATTNTFVDVIAWTVVPAYTLIQLPFRAVGFGLIKLLCLLPNYSPHCS